MKNGCFQISVTHVCQELPLHVLCVFYQLLRGTWLPEWHKAFPKIPPAFSMKTRAWQYPQVASQGLKSEVQSLTWRQIKFFMGLQKLYWGQGYRWIYLETHSRPRGLCPKGTNSLHGAPPLDLIPSQDLQTPSHWELRLQRVNLGGHKCSVFIAATLGTISWRSLRGEMSHQSEGDFPPGWTWL